MSVKVVLKSRNDDQIESLGLATLLRMIRCCYEVVNAEKAHIVE